MDFGKKIKQLRTLLGLTQEELANRCELTKSYISQLENKKRIINPSACVDCGACQLACPKKCISQN